jgi:hypothetical protein
MNGDVPLLSLDPSAEGVSYAPVFHGVELGHKSEAAQGVAIRGEHCKTARAFTVVAALWIFTVLPHP